MQMPERSVVFTQVAEWDDGAVRLHDDDLAVEEPLEIRIDDYPVTVTMRTPGHDAELAAGFLWTENLIESRDQIMSLGPAENAQESNGSATRNVVNVRLSDSSFDPETVRRNFFAASSCGICGKASIEAIRARDLQPPNPAFFFDPKSLCELPERLRAQQQVFGKTGGLHAAALFDAAGKLLVLREDIGRHNAVDKIVGWALQRGLLPLSSHVMLVSGRGGFEIVQKAIAAGIPIVASVSAPSSLAVRLARELGLTLVGFLRGRRFVVYAGQARCLPAPLD
jgi:FdhD protein